MSAPMPPTARRAGALQEYVPGLALVGSYDRSWLGKDVVAGLVLSALLVPQGMAYAELAGLPPVTGLYTSILCLLGYAVFGPSRILVLGPDSSLGPMIAATIAPLALAGGDPSRAVALRVGPRPARRPRHDGRGPGPLRLRRRPALQAHPDRLHERARADHHRRPAAQALRLLRRRRRAASRRQGPSSPGVADRPVNANAAAIGVVSLVGILLLQRLLPKIPAVLVVVVARGPHGQPPRPQDDGSRHHRRAAAGVPAADHPDGARGRTCPSCSSGRSPSPSSPWPTRCRPRRRSRPAVGSGCEATRR